MDFAIQADNRGKLNESKEREKYKDLARELKKLLNMKVAIIPIVISALGTVTKRLVQRLDDLDITGWMETVQTTALLRSARILRRVLETWGDLLSLKIQWKPSANADVKNWWDCSWEDLDMTMKGSSQEIKWISSNNNTKQHHKDQLYSSKNY